jgi:hypothetical protein
MKKGPRFRRTWGPCLVSPRGVVTFYPGTGDSTLPPEGGLVPPSTVKPYFSPSIFSDLSSGLPLAALLGSPRLRCHSAYAFFVRGRP